MLLPAHNAHLTTITTRGVVADPSLDCAAGGAGPEVRWSGDAQAELKDVFTEQVRNEMRVIVRQVNVKLPSNLPIGVYENDLLTFTTLRGEEVVLEVRGVDKTFWGLGQNHYTCFFP